MKQLLILLTLLASTNLLHAQSEEAYKVQMDIIDAQGEQILQEFRALQQKDPQREMPATRERFVQLSAKYDSLANEQLKLIKQIIRENHDNQIPAKYIKEAMYQFSYEELKAALDPTAAYYNSPELEKPKRLLAGYEKRRPGMKFHDLEMEDTDDRYATLSQWVGQGQYVLIDFWASWCGPCRQEMPNVVKNYEKYHSKGFNIVGVSLDQKKESWVAAIQQLGMKWPQISDLKGWKSAAVDVYGISSIPSSVLVAPDGTIVAIDLRGNSLSEKLREIYGE